VTRRLLVLGTALLLSSPLGAQVVGFPPDQSPYEDLRGRQGLAYGVGVISPGGDPAGIAPGQGVLLSATYQVRLSSALWLNTRVGYVPNLLRQVKDPLFSGAKRDYGTSVDPYLIVDGSFGINLAGNKSWRRLSPQLHGGLGVVSTIGEGYDLGGYRFGTKMQLSYGMSLRVPTGHAWEWQADVTHMFWKYKYPSTYRGDGSATDESILGARKLTAWKGNAVLQVGVARYFRR
jgi:hypothetical protein